MVTTEPTVKLMLDGAMVARIRRGVARKYMVTPHGLWNLLRHPRQ